MADINEACVFGIDIEINDGYPYLKELSTDFMTEEEEGVSIYPYNYKTPFTINPRINDGYPYLKELSTDFLECGDNDKRTYKAYLGDIPIVKMYYGDVEVTKLL